MPMSTTNLPIPTVVHHPRGHGAPGSIPHSPITHSNNESSAFTPIRPAKRRLTFVPTVRVKPVKKLSSTQEEKSRLYHSRGELYGFHQRAKEFCFSHPDRPACVTRDSPRRRECLVRLHADHDMRGLESFFYPIRQRNKSLARKSLLKHYGDLNGPKCEGMSEEQKIRSLAAASQKLSYWSKLVAMETARLDTVRAYGGGDRRQSPVCTTPVDDDLSIKRRTVSFDDDDSDDGCQPSKRRRLGTYMRRKDVEIARE